MRKKQQAPLTQKETIIKIAPFCAYQERTPEEVRKKLASWGTDSMKTELVIKKLQEEQYLDIKRFSESFVRGKFYHKKWGKRKIRYQLQQKGVQSQYIEDAISTIKEEDYQKNLYDLLISKKQNMKEMSKDKKKQKLYTFGISRGYETDLVFQIINKLL